MLKSKFKSILYLLGILFIAALAKIIGRSVGKTAIKSFNNEEVNITQKGQSLKELINKLNEQVELPMRIDENTTLVRVYAVGDDLLMYEYEIAAEDIDVVKLRPMVFERIKDNLGKKAKSVGLSVGYTYKSSTTKKILAVIIFDSQEF